MIDPSKIGRLRSLVIVSRNHEGNPQAFLLAVVTALADLLADLAEAAAPATPAKAEPPTIRLAKRSPSKTFIEDVEWQKDRGLLLLRHLAARPGSVEVRTAVEEYLRDLDLEGKPVPPIGRLAAADPGPKTVPVANAQPIDIRPVSPRVERPSIDAGRARLRAEAHAETVSLEPPKHGPAGGLQDVPWHSQAAADAGATAGRNGDGPEMNPHRDASRGIAGAKRIWWERARQAAKG